MKALLARERRGSTAVGDGVAIPHVKVHGLSALVASFGRSKAGVDFGARDGTRSFLFFTLVSPETPAAADLKALVRIMRLLSVAGLRESVMRAGSAREIYRLIGAEDAMVGRAP